MFDEAKELVMNSNSIYIVGHADPDGDSIGSAYSLCLSLNKIGKDANVIMSNYSSTFDFLIDSNVETVDKSYYDLLICVDSSDKTRLDIKDEDYKKAKHILVIDHHMPKSPYGDLRCVDSTLPATCELVYNFITFLNIEIDANIAKYIYSGLVTDSGNFSYSSTKPSTLKIAANLIETGINFSDICKRLNDTIKEGKLKLIAKTIDNMEVFFDGKLRYSFVSYNEIAALGVSDEDAEGMTNYLRMVENTDISIYVREKSDGTLKVSMRSGNSFDVSKIAIALGGGGHARAAGYTMIKEYNEGKKELIDMIEVMIK